MEYTTCSVYFYDLPRQQPGIRQKQTQTEHLRLHKLRWDARAPHIVGDSDVEKYKKIILIFFTLKDKVIIG